MRARAMAPVTAIIGALILNASAAHGQATAPELPSSSEEPRVSVPKVQPGPEPTSAGPDSAQPAVGSTPAPSAARPQAPSLAEPKMIHEPRNGFVLAGSFVLAPAYFIQLLAAAGTSASATDSSCSCYSTEAKLLLIPIVGPWLASRAAPQQEQGSPLPYLIYGAIEAAGATMLIVGLVGRDVPQEPIAQGRTLTFLPFVTPRTEGLSLFMHW
jgi:hypothetical protein